MSPKDLTQFFAGADNSQQNCRCTADPTIIPVHFFEHKTESRQEQQEKQQHTQSMGRHRQAKKGHEDQHEQTSAEWQQTGIGKIRVKNTAAVIGSFCPVYSISTIRMKFALAGKENIINHNSCHKKQQHWRQSKRQTLSEIQIWTDIDGMHNNDPRIVDKTAPVRHLHFEEAAELAYFGAKILHPTCIQPAKYANIPVRLLNTMDPTAPGTMISNDTEKGKIKAVAAKDNITAIKSKSSRMLLAHGFLRKVFEIFESYQTSIDMICTSEVGVSVSVDNTKHLNEILDDLKKYGTVTVDKDMCIVCVVGDLEWENVGFEAKALDAMRDIPVRMISFGGSNYNISFLIRECDKNKALQSLSDALFNEE